MVSTERTLKMWQSSEDLEKIRPFIKTAPVTSQKQVAATVERCVRRAWLRCVKAEERTRLLKVMIREGFGTNDLENFRAKQSNMRFGKGRGEREDKRVVQDMRDKLNNAIEWEKEKRRERGQQRSKLEKLVGSKSTCYKTFINKVKDKMRKEQQKIKKKNNEKISQLKSRVKKDEFKLPQELSRYGNAKVFTKNGEEMTPAPLR